jgi:hypothetical protein
MNVHTTVEELLGAVFSNQFMSKLYKEGQQDSEYCKRELHASQSRETVKYGNEFCGTQNQEWLCWQPTGSTAVLVIAWLPESWDRKI